MPRQAKQKPASALGDPVLTENIKNLLESREMKPVDLARRLHISPQSVSQWLQCQSAPSRRRIAAIAAILGVSTETLRSPPSRAEQPARPAEAACPENHLRLRRHRAGAEADDGDQQWLVPAAAFRDLATDRPDLVIITTTGTGLEPEVRAGELVVVDCKWRRVSGRGVYLTGNMPFPTLKLCEPAAGSGDVVYVYEAAGKREIPADALAVLGRAVCKLLVPL